MSTGKIDKRTRLLLAILLLALIVWGICFAVGRTQQVAFPDPNLEQAIREQPQFITVCSFNEWGEGTQIEPCLEYGDLYLELTAKWAKAFRESHSVVGSAQHE